MGCDIHAYIEAQRYLHRGDTSWTTFAPIPFIPRNYTLFGALTDGEVRGDPMPDEGFPLRGIPDDVDSEVAGEYYETAHRDVEPGTAETERDKWLEKLGSRATVRIGQASSLTMGMGRHDGRELHTWLTARWPAPDWHSPSWLTTKELERCVAWAEETDPWWAAILVAMRTLEAQGYPARFVFWFDN